MNCDERSLRMLLADDLNSPVLPDVHAHLDTCVACQTRLLQLADEQNLSCDLGELAADGHLESPSSALLSSASIVIALDGSLAADAPAVCEPVSLDFLAAPSHPEMLGRLDRYEIERLIGAGGMGIVLKGFDTELNRPVAIKVLAPHLAGSGVARSRFSREAQAAAAIVHENVVPIHDVAMTRPGHQVARDSIVTARHEDAAMLEVGLPYLVMPYIAGQSLQARIDERGHLSVKDIVRIAHQSALGLAAAHAQGIVHRDVKPANILLEGDVDRVRISDFGLARAADDASVTRSGIIAGTPQYMSPEQTRGEAIDHRSDLFSLGSVLYTMCTGRAPFRAETTMGILRKISDETPRSIVDLNCEIPAWLAALTDKLMSKHPAERFQSADEVAVLLEQCLAHLHQPARLALPHAVRQLVRVERTRYRRRQLMWGLASVLTVASILSAWYLSGVLNQPNSAVPSNSQVQSTGRLHRDPRVAAVDGLVERSASQAIAIVSPESEPDVFGHVAEQLDRLEAEIQQLQSEITAQSAQHRSNVPPAR